MHRRRFIATLSALGLPRLLVGQSSGPEAAEFSCSTSLERGVVPGVAGIQARVSGRPGFGKAEGRLDFLSEPASPSAALRFLDDGLVRERWSAFAGGSSALPKAEELVADADCLRLAIGFRGKSGELSRWSLNGGPGVTVDEALLVMPAVMLADPRQGPYSFQLSNGGQIFQTLPATVQEIEFKAGRIAGMREAFWRRVGDASLHDLVEQLCASESVEVALVDRRGHSLVRYRMDLSGYSVVKRWIAESVFLMYRNHRQGDCLQRPVDPHCYLTTATVTALGLDDDCWELRTLRRLRDGYLNATSEGRTLVAAYYERAPSIVSGLQLRPDAPAIWRRTYWSGVLPTALLARAGCARAAVAWYAELTRRLERLASRGGDPPRLV